MMISTKATGIKKEAPILFVSRYDVRYELENGCKGYSKLVGATSIDSAIPILAWGNFLLLEDLRTSQNVLATVKKMQ